MKGDSVAWGKKTSIIREGKKTKGTASCKPTWWLSFSGWESTHSGGDRWKTGQPNNGRLYNSNSETTSQLHGVDKRDSSVCELKRR